MIFSLDLANFGVDSQTAFGLEDVLDTAFYRLELLDAAMSPLSLAGLQLSHFNLDFGGGTVTDYDLSLDAATGQIVAVRVHDSGTATTARHSGLTVFSSLPLTTRFVRLFVGGTSGFPRDGLRLSLAGTALPEPSLLILLALGLAGAGIRRREV